MVEGFHGTYTSMTTRRRLDRLVSQVHPSTMDRDTARARKRGVTLGKSYPQPIVDHKVGRERALAAYAKTRHAT
jgi:deoxyribodipyrimidine photolyase